MTVPQLSCLHYKTVTSGFGLAGVLPGVCLRDLFQARLYWCCLTEWLCWEPGGSNGRSNNQTAPWIIGKVRFPSRSSSAHRTSAATLWWQFSLWCEVAATVQVLVGLWPWCSCTRKQMLFSPQIPIAAPSCRCQTLGVGLGKQHINFEDLWHQWLVYFYLFI